MPETTESRWKVCRLYGPRQCLDERERERLESKLREEKLKKKVNKVSERKREVMYFLSLVG